MKAQVQKIDIENKQITLNYISDLKLKEFDFVEIKKIRKKRTLNQNDLYHLFKEFCANELDMEPGSVHSGWKELHLRKTKVINGNLFYYTGSTADLNTEEFAQYFEKCNRTAIEFDVNTQDFWIEYERYKTGW